MLKSPCADWRCATVLARNKDGRGVVCIDPGNIEFLQFAPSNWRRMTKDGMLEKRRKRRRLNATGLRQTVDWMNKHRPLGILHSRKLH